MNESPVRQKNIEWTDPLATALLMRERDGVDALRAMMNGEIPYPPIAKLFGLHFHDVEVGKVRMSIVPDESHYNPMGMVHGGVMATVLDTAMGCSVQSTLPKSRGYTTLSISVNYIRAITISTGELFAEGTVIHGGRTTALAQGRVVDTSGKLYATADTTCLLFDRPA